MEKGKSLSGGRQPDMGASMSGLNSILQEMNLIPRGSNRRKRILVIDDDIRMLRVIKQHLEAEYDIATAINGSLALRFLKNNIPDLILLDYEMPEEKGPEVLKKIRKIDSAKNIPVLFLTGTAERRKIKAALELKPQGYLLKPIQQDVLLSRIKNIIG